MSKGMQLIVHPLTTPAYSTGQQTSVNLNELADRVYGRIAHLVGFLLDFAVTPTFTTAPTIDGLHALVSNIIFHDGTAERFNASLHDLRLFEIGENGKLLIPDPDLNSGSTNMFAFRRFLPVGFWNAAGSPSDGMLPSAAIRNGEFRIKYGALTDFSADTTAITCVPKVSAVYAVLDNELRIAPFVERRTQTLSATESTINGRALYHTLALRKTTIAAFADGDLTEITVDCGQGTSWPVRASVLQALAHTYTRATHLTQFAGEPRAATDDNAKKVNLASPTAFAAADLFLQAVISSPQDVRISKMIYETSATLKEKHSGTATALTALMTRIMSQSDDVVNGYAARACAQLKLSPKATKIKTLSKEIYTGPRKEFMPYTVKVG